MARQSGLTLASLSMPTTVIAAFKEFLSDVVNLDPSDTALARASRDWLLTQINSIAAAYSDFPPLYPDVNIAFGSFARRTKTRELDDVDLIVGVMALGATYMDSFGKVHLSVPDGIVLRGLCHDGTNLLNSRKVINAFIRRLKDVPQYNKAETGRNQSAAVLNLQSYSWSFDIVPAFFTNPEWDGRTYYIIPDGEGHWMKTDPRLDQARVTNVNQAHSGNVLDAVRLMKFWNARPTMPTMPSYLIETIVLDYYASVGTPATSYVDLEFLKLLDYVSRAVLVSVNDPKNIQGDINSLSWDARLSISSRAGSDLKDAQAARKAETEDDHRTAIRRWGGVLGPSFPTYG